MTELEKNQPGPEEDTPKDPVQEEYEEGQQFLKDKNLPQAANAFHNALIGFEKNANEPGIANASDKLGDICKERETFDKALEHYKRAYEICNRLEDISSTVTLEKKIAACYRGLKQYDKTLDMYFKLFDTFSDWKNPALTIEMLEQIAELYVEMGDKKKAIDAYETAASIHNNYKHPRHAQKLIDKADALKG